MLGEVVVQISSWKWENWELSNLVSLADCDMGGTLWILIRRGTQRDQTPKYLRKSVNKRDSSEAPFQKLCIRICFQWLIQQLSLSARDYQSQRNAVVYAVQWWTELISLSTFMLGCLHTFLIKEQPQCNVTGWATAHHQHTQPPQKTLSEHTTDLNHLEFDTSLWFSWESSQKTPKPVCIPCRTWALLTFQPFSLPVSLISV